MKIRYSYYSLRFPSNIASICVQFEKELNARYVDLPFLLPTESKVCEYKGADIIEYKSEKYYVANKEMDVCFYSPIYLNNRCFGVISISEEVQMYVLWTNFYDEKIHEIITNFSGENSARVFSNPHRVSVTLKCGDMDV